MSGGNWWRANEISIGRLIHEEASATVGVTKPFQPRQRSARPIRNPRFVPPSRFTRAGYVTAKIPTTVVLGDQFCVAHRVCRALGIDDEDARLRAETQRLAGRSLSAIALIRPARPTPPLSPATMAGSDPTGRANRFIAATASSSSMVMNPSATRDSTRQAIREGS